MKISLEVFPPKKDSEFVRAFEIMDELAALEPDFISVTYGAGGSRSKSTLDIASYIQNTLGIPAVAHLTCVGGKRAAIDEQCAQFQSHNIANVLALRGDRPRDMTDEQYAGREFRYASDLVSHLRATTPLTLWGACYPEKHFESFSRETDLRWMRLKQDLGVSEFITQMFFDNDFFYDFRERAARKGITAPIHAGIMPITRVGQLGTTISLSGSSIPKPLADLIAAHADSPEDMFRAGLDYAIRQIDDLIQNGVDGVHLYTMNKPDIARQIVEAL